jgi:hypothetical protein
VKSRKQRTHLLGVVVRAKRNAFDIYGRWAMGIHIDEGKPEDILALVDFFKDEA